jgi:precorrin-6B methylase 2
MIIQTYDDLYEHIKGISMVNKDKIYNIMYYLSKAKNLPGDIAELGVCAGGITRLMALMAPNKFVYAFDTFEGMPFDDEKGSHKKGDFRVKSYLISS